MFLCCASQPQPSAVHMPIGKILFWGQGTPNEMENLDVYLMEEGQNGYQFTNYPLESGKAYCTGHTLNKSGKPVLVGGEDIQGGFFVIPQHSSEA